MDLSIIFVNWNATHYLHECIASIYENTDGIKFEIIVVDNASPKGDVDSLKVVFPDITIIKSNENLGFARANNVGFRRSSGSYVLLLNPDTKLVGPAINILLDRLKSLPDAGIVGCRQVNPDLSVQTTSMQKFPKILNQVLDVDCLHRFWPHCRLWDISPLFSDVRTPVATEVIPGACMLLRREVFEQVGMFGEEYFMYGEDIDLNYKVARAGFKNYYVPDAVIIHYGGRSSAQQQVSQWSTTMQFRAMGQFYVKNHGRLYAAMYRTAIGSCAVIRLLMIVLAFPFGNIFWSRQSLRSASEKWSAVLKWACLISDRSLNATSNR